MLTGDNGILTQAQKAKEETENAQANEENVLDSYEQYIGGLTNGGTLITVTGEETTNTTVKDSLENKVTVPAGFKVVNSGDNVEDGIIIEDVSHSATAGSQFVWIPVGTIQTTKGEKKIDLKRYVFNSDGSINEEKSTTEPETQIEDYTVNNETPIYCYEALKDNTTSNTHAKDIETFISKVKLDGGYYLARYEARTAEQRTKWSDELKTMTIKANDFIYNYVSQSQAANLSRNMYNDTNFTSDLVNSYAWDTAIYFIQTCSDDNDYSRQTSLNNVFLEKGISEDRKCNIYDLASNCEEWSTETCANDSTMPGIARGGIFSYPNVGSNFYPASRDNNSLGDSYQYISFRPLLYL